MGDVDEATLAEEREHIKRGQQDVARKKEELERLGKDKLALEDEYRTKTVKLEEISDQYKMESKKAMKMKHAADQRTAAAENDYMSAQVRRFLQERIPAMATDEGDAGHAGDGGGFQAGATPAAAADDGKQVLHDTVIVSHVNIIGDKKEEDYKVSYKIDANITVAQLLKDCCAYWGCSRRDYCLCSIVNDIPQDLSNKMEEKLQSEVLDAAERAHVHLVRRVDMEQFKAQSQKMKQEAEKKRQNQAASGEGKEKAAESEGMLKTLKHGLGSVAAEANEPFVEALKPWPGIYSLLKNRNRKKDNMKWQRTSLIDFCCFNFLALFTGLSLTFRSTTQVFFLQQGVHSAIVEGIDGQSTSGVTQYIEGVKTVPMAMEYLKGTFDYQIFNPESNLRSSYVPVGAMRLRVQKAKERTCERPDIPDGLVRPCQYVQVNANTMTQSELLFPSEYLALDNGESTLTRLMDQGQGDPRVWAKSTHATEIFHGYVQQAYARSGYQYWFPINQNDLYNVTSKMGELEWLLSTWLTTDARLLTVELALANYNLGGYVATTLLLEISASGAASMSAVVSPFHLANTSGDQSAAIIDGFRFIIVIGYLLLIKVWTACEHKVEDGGSGLHYVLSVVGCLDSAIVGLFLADQYFLSFLSPDRDPTTSASSENFVSYSAFARLQEQLNINEACLLMLLIVRCTILGQMQPAVYRGFKTFVNSIVMFAYYLTIFLPVMLSAIFLANCIWSPYVQGYSTWVNTFLSVTAMMQNIHHTTEISKASAAWTIIFSTYTYVVIYCFFVNGFLAISSYAYFQSELVEYSDPKYERWTRDQWVDWMLWGKLYTMYTGKEPGSSKKVGLAEEEEDEGGEEEDDEDDD